MRDLQGREAWWMPAGGGFVEHQESGLAGSCHGKTNGQYMKPEKIPVPGTKIKFQSYKEWTCFADSHTEER